MFSRIANLATMHRIRHVAICIWAYVNIQIRKKDRFRKKNNKNVSKIFFFWIYLNFSNFDNKRINNLHSNKTKFNKNENSF